MHKCEECGREFGTRRGLSIHGKLAHGVERAGAKPLICEHCGKVFVADRGRSVKKYCSHDCYAAENTGANHHQYVARVDIPCSICGKMVPLVPSRAAGKKVTRCSECYAKVTASSKRRAERGVGDWACSVCGVRFRTQKGLTSHQTKKHPDIIADAHREFVGLYPTMNTADLCRKLGITEGAGEAIRRRYKLTKESDITVACRACGIPFVAQRHHARFCPQHITAHARAASADYSRRRRAEPTTRQCEQCGEEFGCSAASERRFCGLWRCEKIGIKSDRPGTRTCAACGKSIERHVPKATAHAYCSKKCRSAGMSELLRGSANPNYGNGQAVTGEKNGRWQGDAARYMNDLRGRWFARQGGRQWARDARKRDAYTCQRCGIVKSIHSGGLQVHHKAGFTAYPTVRTVLANAVVLCEPCHDWLHSNEGELVRLRWEQDALRELAHLLPEEQRPKQPRKRQAAATTAQAQDGAEQYQLAAT